MMDWREFCFYILGFGFGFVTCALLSRSLTNKQIAALSFHGDSGLRALFFSTFKRIDIDQAYLLMVKDREFRSWCWSKENLVYWQKISEFERSVFEAMKSGEVVNPFAGEVSEIITERMEEGRGH